MWYLSISPYPKHTDEARLQILLRVGKIASILYKWTERVQTDVVFPPFKVKHAEEKPDCILQFGADVTDHCGDHDLHAPA